MRSRILIISHRGDPHVDVVTELLARLGHDPVLLCTSDFPANGRIDIRVGGEGGFRAELSSPRGRLDLAEVGAVWWKRGLPHRASAALPEAERDWAEHETAEAVTGLWRILARDSQVYWLGEPDRMRAASSKPEQLHRAGALGFTVPETLISTDPGEARRFIKSHAAGVVHKDLGNRFLGPSTVCWEPGAPPPPLELMAPAMVTDTHLGRSEAVAFSPCLFQAFVPKRHELRVTVVEEQVFACAISDSEGSSSWLTAKTLDGLSDGFDYHAYEIPDTLRQRCVDLVRSYGLTYGAIDIAITPEGEYVFFELNPDGEWIHIQEKIPTLDIATAIADTLARHCTPTVASGVASARQ